MAATSLILAGFGLRNRRGQDYTTQLEHRIDILEKDVRECNLRASQMQAQVDQLMRQNHDLLVRLAGRP